MNIGAEVRTQFSIEEEDDLLQFAIQQSLLEAGSERDEVHICVFVLFYTIFKISLYYIYNIYILCLLYMKNIILQVDIWEALRAQKPSRPTTPNMTTEEERQLQRYAINTY